MREGLVLSLYQKLLIPFNFELLKNAGKLVILKSLTFQLLISF